MFPLKKILMQVIQKTQNEWIVSLRYHPANVFCQDLLVHVGEVLNRGGWKVQPYYTKMR